MKNPSEEGLCHKERITPQIDRTIQRGMKMNGVEK